MSNHHPKRKRSPSDSPSFSPGSSLSDTDTDGPYPSYDPNSPTSVTTGSDGEGESTQSDDEVKEIKNRRYGNNRDTYKRFQTAKKTKRSSTNTTTATAPPPSTASTSTFIPPTITSITATPSPASSAKKKGRKKDAKLLFDRFSTAITGVPGKTQLVGFRKTTAGCVMEYDGPAIPPRKAFLDILRDNPEYWDKFIQRLGSISFFATMSRLQREDWLKDHQIDTQIHLDYHGSSASVMFKEIGETCSLMEKLKPDVLVAWQSRITPLPATDIEQAFRDAEDELDEDKAVVVGVDVDDDISVNNSGGATVSVATTSTTTTTNAVATTAAATTITLPPFVTKKSKLSTTTTNTNKSTSAGGGAKRKSLFMLCEFWKIDENPTVVREWTGSFCSLSNCNNSLDAQVIATKEPSYLSVLSPLVLHHSGESCKIMCRTTAPSLFAIHQQSPNNIRFAIHDPALDLLAKNIRKHEDLLQETMMDALSIPFDEEGNVEAKEFMQVYEHVKALCIGNSHVTPAFYKSMLQKLIRYQPLQVILPSTISSLSGTTISSAKVKAEWVLTIVMGFLFQHEGSFVPDIQRFVTGTEALCKRLLIIACEDSYTSSIHDLTFLACCALLAQRHRSSWFPCQGYVVGWFRFGLQLMNERRRFAYDWKKPCGEPFTSLQEGKSHLWSNFSVMVNLLKSFKSDEATICDIAHRHIIAAAEATLISSYKVEAGSTGATAVKVSKSKDHIDIHVQPPPPPPSVKQPKRAKVLFYNDDDDHDISKTKKSAALASVTTEKKTVKIDDDDDFSVPSVSTTTTTTTFNQLDQKKTNNSNKRLRPSTMAWEHAIDFHYDTRFAYFLDPQLGLSLFPSTVASEPFHPLFRAIFKHVTGQNPRKHKTFTLLQPERKYQAFIEDVQRAQRLYWSLLQPTTATQAHTQPLSQSKLTKLVEQFEYALDDGWLAAGGVCVLKPPPIPRTSAASSTTTTTTNRRRKPTSAGETVNTIVAIKHVEDIQDGFVAICQPSKVASRAATSSKSAVELSPEEKKIAIDWARNHLIHKGVKWNGCTPPVAEWKRATVKMRELVGKSTEEDDEDFMAAREDIKYDPAKQYEYVLEISSGQKRVKGMPPPKKKIVPWMEAKNLRRSIPVLDDPKDEIVDEDRQLLDYVHDPPPSTGVFKAGRKRWAALLTRTDLGVLKRLSQYLSQKEPTIKLPAISRDGGRVEEMVLKEDICVFQILLKLARWFPVALRYEPPLTIQVLYGPYVWMLADHLRNVITLRTKSKDEAAEEAGRAGGDTSDSSSTITTTAATTTAATTTTAAATVDSFVGRWKPFVDRRKRSLWDHQHRTLAQMRERVLLGYRGHFVWIPVGLGKTLIVIYHLEYLREKGDLPEYMIYTLPPESIQTIADEFREFGHEVCIWDPTKTGASKIRKQNKAADAAKSVEKNSVAKDDDEDDDEDDNKPLTACKPAKRLPHKPKSPTPVTTTTTAPVPLAQPIKRVAYPERYRITLLAHDHVRFCSDTLLEVLTKGNCIVDEVHRFLNHSQRTMGGLRAAYVCNEFTAMTGTPVIDANLKKLIHWFKLICNYPVNVRNFWVSAMNMLAHRVDIGVEITRERIIGDMNSTEQQTYRDCMPEKMGGTNKHATGADVRRGLKVCNDACDRKMVDEIHRLVCVEGRRGVFVVAESYEHQSWIWNELKTRYGWTDDEMIRINNQTSVNLTSLNVATDHPKCRVVITTIQKSSGYTVSRFDTMIWRPYPCNQATREQQEGRIARIGQISKTIYYITVVDSAGFYERMSRKQDYPRQMKDILEFALDDNPITVAELTKLTTNGANAYPTNGIVDPVVVE